MLTPPHELQPARICSCSGFPLISRLPGRTCGWLIFQVPSRSLKSSALTCPGCNFYRFLMFHLNPVTYDIHLHSICQLQQKSNLEWHSTLHVVHPTLGVWAWTQSSYNWNIKVCAVKTPAAFDVCDCDVTFLQTLLFSTPLPRTEVQVPFKVT